MERFSIRGKIKAIVQRLRGSSAAQKPAEPGYYCLVGNIVAKHEFGNEKELLSGTKHFTPGTKVYCLPLQWGDGYENAVVVGICHASGPAAAADRFRRIQCAVEIAKGSG